MRALLSAPSASPGMGIMGVLNKSGWVGVDTSKLEGINNKIKMLFRRIYVYPEMQYIKLNVKRKGIVAN